VRICVTTSDMHLPLVSGWAELFNRHWSSSQEVTVLGFRSPSESLPPNFSFTSMGRQEDYGEKVWTDPLAHYFRSVNDKCIAIFMEDHMFVGDVDFDLLARAVDHIEGGRAQKAEFGCYQPGGREVGPAFSADPDFVVAPDRWSGWAVATLWDREHLLRFLPAGLDPWQQQDYHPGGDYSITSLIPRRSSIAQICEVIRGGKFRDNIKEGIDGQAKAYSEEDWKILNRYRGGM